MDSADHSQNDDMARSPVEPPSAEETSNEGAAGKVKSIIAEQLGVEASEVTEAASFTDDLGADSLDIVELVMAFEEEFGIEIPDEDAEKIVRVEDACNYIAEHAEDGGE